MSAGGERPKRRKGHHIMDIRERLEVALENELTAVSEYAELANDVTNQTLRAVLISIMGDKYGHARTLAALLINGS